MSDNYLNFSPSVIEQNISVSMKLRKILPEIEELMKQGLPRKAILERLNSKGFNLTLETFANALYRLRKDAKKTTNTSLTKREIPSTGNEVIRKPKDPLPKREQKTFSFDPHEPVKF